MTAEPVVPPRPIEAPVSTASTLAPRTRRLLEAPILPTLLGLAFPTLVLNVVQTAIMLIEAAAIGRLGRDALAGVAFVFPLFMLMQMMSAGAIGGGISAAVARALGAGDRAGADRVAAHAIVLGLAIGVAFAAAMLTGGPALYALLGAEGASLSVAVAYSTVLFAGVPLLWLFNSLASVLRGTGDMASATLATLAGAAVAAPLAPALVLGFGPLPAMGATGGATALVVYYAIASAVLAWRIASPRATVRPRLVGGISWAPFRAILRVGAIAALIALQTNVVNAVLTGIVAGFGPAAAAGYGLGLRLEYLMVPLVFSVGAPLVAMVGTAIGAGEGARAVRAAWTGAALAAAATGTIGVGAALWPDLWLGLFTGDAETRAMGALYFAWAGPCFVGFGVGMTLYFASQGAGRLAWPFAAAILRLTVALVGAWIGTRMFATPVAAFAAGGAGLLVFGLVNAWAVGGGAWFGPGPLRRRARP